MRQISPSWQPRATHPTLLKEFAEQLLAMESAENIKQHYSFALSACAVYNWPDVAEKLFDTGIDANSLVDGRTALYVACREEHENLVRLLLAHGADPNKPNTVTLEKPEETPARLKSRAKLIRKSDAESSKRSRSLMLTSHCRCRCKSFALSATPTLSARCCLTARRRKP